VGKEKKGLVLVFTGNGKGKTTAALGLALRAIGHDFHVYMLQFKKSNSNIGEFKAINQYLPHFTIVQSGINKMSAGGYLEDDEAVIVQNGFLQGKKALQSGEYDLVIFDEINIVMDNGQLSIQEVLEMLASRPPHVDVVLTGRNAPLEIINFADLVSEVKEIKHHFKSGIKARKGVEF
jgi:cob(I)alamin adenosyltransferase